MATVSQFDRLFTKRVPHIHEKIFFSIDYESFKQCLEVSKSWNYLLTSESFLRRSKSVFCEDIQKEIMLAAERGNVDIIQRVLSNFMVDINFMTELHGSPLIRAVRNGHKDVVNLLLDGGAEPNLAHKNGKTPLQYAAQQGHKYVVQLLLDRGAEINMADQRGLTPLHWAAINGHTEVVQLLFDRGAELNIAAQNGVTLLHCAASKGHKEVVQLLLDRGHVVF